MGKKKVQFPILRLLASEHVIIGFRDPTKILAIIFAQILLSILDLIGVVILGLVGTISFNGVQGTQSNKLTNTFLEILGLGNFEFQIQVSILASAAVAILILKTILSIFFTRKTFLYFAKRAAILSGRILDHIIKQDLQYLTKNSSADNLHTVTVGSNSLMLGVLATSVTIISDLSLLLVLTIGLFVLSPLSTLLTIAMFGLMAWLMHKLLDERAEKMGRSDSKLQIQSNKQIRELFSSYRETLVQNSQRKMIHEVVDLRSQLADTQAEMALMPNLSKYIIESCVLLFAFLLSGIQFITQDAIQAISSLAIFLAAGTRMAPALLRIQQGSLKVRNHLGHAYKTLEVMENMEVADLENLSTVTTESQELFVPEVKIRKVRVAYEGSTELALTDIDLEIAPGQFVAITGPSGAGKSTLVDVMLGVIHPTSGSVNISGYPPRECFKQWPGRVGYVPQEVFILDGTIRENIALGGTESIVDDSRVWRVLELVALKSFVRNLPYGLDTLVGEHGSLLSGGQKQRLGIARALFFNPQFLIMDEATSALDAETESEISKSISQLKGEVTLVVISHRYSTISNADRVLYIEEGEIQGDGSFQKLMNENMSFRNQARLMGLDSPNH
jgi:ABC-type multidrug transport system fused ATPase/permease subunit